MRKLLSVMFVLLGLCALVIGGTASRTAASSHRESPFITDDPRADGTDLYAFVSPDAPDTVTLIANYVPFQIPASGPNFYRFGEDVLYEINVDNNGDAREDITFQFRFRFVINNGETFLYNTGPVTRLDDPDLNQEQFYSVSILDGERSNLPMRQGEVIADNLQVAPYDVGPVSFPDYPMVARQAVHTIPLDEYGTENIKVFAGPRDDPFFIDLGGTFDLLKGIRGVDDLEGLNVHSIAIQVPTSLLKGSDSPIIGVWTTSYRQMMNVLRPGFGEPGANFDMVQSSKGPWVQISRLDLPLINEVIIPLKDKDRWNASEPINDEQFLNYVLDPELAELLHQILGVNVPPTPRQDLVTALLMGIPGLNQPPSVEPASLLRLNMDTAPAGSIGDGNRLGVLAGDLAGFPNGRRPADDVVDISLQVVGGELVPGFSNDLGDNVPSNDKSFMNEFPYLALPHDYRDTDKE